ncbi:MAG: glycosyltransferase family 39 protein [Candidatus Sulfopaludibacter sp.]|nr:glycosyltransferase family 39 protein [Candidatus Sulfopaludibacter sp.]
MEAGVSRRFGLWLVLGLVLLIRAPFFGGAVQGDDHIYLSAATHALVEPLHPNNTDYVFRGDLVDLRGHPHPPLVAWTLAGLIAIFGDVKEVPFHAAFTVFSLIAAASMWSLARRFSPHPLWATLLFVAVPAFVINGNSFETDVPFLAFWMLAVALFVSGRLWGAGVAMALASLTAYQAVLLCPILAVYLWLNPGNRRRWLVLLVPPVTIAAYQIFERLSTGALPATVLTGYLTIYETLQAKLQNALMLFIHSWFIVFPALAPPALVLAWRRRKEPDTRFLLTWIGIFFVCAVAVAFAGSARYLLPIAAPVALLASYLRPRWLAAGFALQLALSLGLAAMNQQHWAAYRDFAASLRRVAGGHRVWVDNDWGLRFYIERDGGLPLTHKQVLRPGDLVAISELGHNTEIHAPVTPVMKTLEIRPSIPLRLIGLETGSGYSTASRGFWPFGVSAGVVDRVSAVQVGERHPTLEYLTMDAPNAADHIVTGIWPDHWMSRSAVVVLRNPAVPKPLSASIYISDKARARKVTLLLDGREVASQTFPAPGPYTLASAPVRAAGTNATVEIDVDQTFTVPQDARELGVIVTGIGFQQ